MNYEWGRVPEAGRWQRAVPVWFMSVILLALASGIGFWWVRQTSIWTPLQQFYLSAYARSALATSLGIQTGRYRLLLMENRRGTRLPIDEEVVPVSTPTGETNFALSDLARYAGAGRLVWRDLVVNHARLNVQLRAFIYADQTLMELARPSLITALVVLMGGLLVAIPKDVRWSRSRRHGRRLKGPELMSVHRFNRRTHGNGIRFVQVPHVAARLLGIQPVLKIPRAIEASHILVMGDSGTGKSALIRQLLQQLEDRDDTAIVYDPALEYTPQFYTPERGDVILNPIDARSPYWSPGDELRHEAEALTLATSLFPDRVNENPFFTEGPRRIFAHLLTFRPSADELASWLCHDDELDRRVDGTPYASIIDRQAPAQRSGVLAALNMVADTLKLLPRESQTTRRWSASSWARDRRGWLFLTSTPETRTRLVPLTSLWLDMLVLRLMNRGQPSQRAAWFVLDELASLQRLPQLHTAVTENRKSNNPVVLGFQGRSQLETRYGHDAEAMLSQPATKVFLRTSEPHAAKWISDTIGEVEIERMRESRSKGKYGQRSFGLERQVEPLVMPSEISGLPSLRGYLKLENLVVRLHFPFLDLRARHPAFVERSIVGTKPRPTGVTTPARLPTPIIQSPVPETVIAHERPSSPAVGQQPFFQ
jgi:Type IV secretion-system coupling protein DNA-binding domain